jgi:type IV secretion system protein VirB9
MMIIARVCFVAVALLSLQSCGSLRSCLSDSQVVRGSSDQYVDYYPGSGGRSDDCKDDNYRAGLNSDNNYPSGDYSSRGVVDDQAAGSSRYEEDFPISTDSRIKTYIYNPGGVYLLVLHFGFQSHIEFAKGEEIESIVLGDTFAWKITPLENRLFINPMEKNIRTNMTVITNKKRTYQFDLISKELDKDYERDLVYTIRFYYPKKRGNN